ncbi:MAG: radical SAM protein [Spirochaetaceae bacterium]|jgi:MoaA/NifB/PqqE/SkfB family radical SAM enzyme|nr:radical SAM protein [Spirochaetaceae bacterium]
MPAAIKHPCFSGECSKKFARIHLPVAPNCNIKCNYCRRSFDCVNESRPGVTSKVISPEEALERYMQLKKIIPQISVAGIAGPGDALANIDETLETLRLIRREDADVLFCVSTNGLYLGEYIKELKEAGVTHITVTINAVNIKTAARIYKHAEYNGKRYVREEAAEIILRNQIEGLKAASAAGIVCKVNTVFIKGLNDGEIPEVVKTAKEAGASISNIMQLIPVKGTLFETLPLTRERELETLRKNCEAVLPQMYHCRQCRSDAAGFLGNDVPLRAPAPAAQNPQAKTPAAPLLFAAATKTGVLVDEHFGRAESFSIYEYSPDGIRFKEKRAAPRYCGENCGSGTDSINPILETLSDCSAVLALRIGEAPRSALAQKNIKVFTFYDYIENAVRDAAEFIERAV